MLYCHAIWNIIKVGDYFLWDSITLKLVVGKILVNSTTKFWGTYCPAIFLFFLEAVCMSKVDLCALYYFWNLLSILSSVKGKVIRSKTSLESLLILILILLIWNSMKMRHDKHINQSKSITILKKFSSITFNFEYFKIKLYSYCCWFQ